MLSSTHVWSHKVCSDTLLIMLLKYVRTLCLYIESTTLTYFMYILMFHCISFIMYYSVYFSAICNLCVYVNIIKLPHGYMTFWYIVYLYSIKCLSIKRL